MCCLLADAAFFESLFFLWGGRKRHLLMGNLWHERACLGPASGLEIEQGGMRWEGEIAPNVGSSMPLALPVSHFVTVQVSTPLVDLTGTCCVFPTPPICATPLLYACNLEHISDLLLRSFGPSPRHTICLTICQYPRLCNLGNVVLNFFDIVEGLSCELITPV